MYVYIYVYVLLSVCVDPRHSDISAPTYRRRTKTLSHGSVYDQVFNPRVGHFIFYAGMAYISIYPTRFVSRLYVPILSHVERTHIYQEGSPVLYVSGPNWWWSVICPFICVEKAKWPGAHSRRVAKDRGNKVSMKELEFRNARTGWY